MKFITSKPLPKMPEYLFYKLPGVKSGCPVSGEYTIASSKTGERVQSINISHHSSIDGYFPYWGTTKNIVSQRINPPILWDSIFRRIVKNPMFKKYSRSLSASSYVSTDESLNQACVKFMKSLSDKCSIPIVIWPEATLRKALIQGGFDGLPKRSLDKVNIDTSNRVLQKLAKKGDTALTKFMDKNITQFVYAKRLPKTEYKKIEIPIAN